MIGYKAFDENLQCRGFQFEVGKTYDIGRAKEKEKKMEYIFSGFIEYIYSDDDKFSKLKLRGEDGYKINLISRFEELKDSFKNKVSVSYFLADRACTKDDAMTGFLNQMEGFIEAGNEVDSYYYSEYTNGTDYTTTLSVGGHSLLHELSEEIGKFCILTVEILEEA